MDKLRLLEELQSAVSIAIDNLDGEPDQGEIEAIREELRVALNESLGI